MSNYYLQIVLIIILLWYLNRAALRSPLWKGGWSSKSGVYKHFQGWAKVTGRFKFRDRLSLRRLQVSHQGYHIPDLDDHRSSSLRLRELSCVPFFFSLATIQNSGWFHDEQSNFCRVLVVVVVVATICIVIAYKLCRGEMMMAGDGPACHSPPNLGACVRAARQTLLAAGFVLHYPSPVINTLTSSCNFASTEKLQAFPMFRRAA